MIAFREVERVGGDIWYLISDIEENREKFRFGGRYFVTIDVSKML
jgi:hypothetical protein